MANGKGMLTALGAGAVAGAAIVAGHRRTRRLQDEARSAGKHVPYGPYEAIVKRPLDAVVSAASLVALSPVIAATAVVVRVKLGSPVIFSQKRPGLNGKLFDIYKFRTMTDERDRETGELLSDEVRLTGFGKWLRSTSLDELPELYNILKGDMALIGPRPLITSYLPLYNEEQAHRHDVRPGMTGLAQVRGRNGLSWEEKFASDVEYVRNVNAVEDATIFLKTFKALASREGISSENSVTMEAFEGTPASVKRDSLNVLFISLGAIEDISTQSIYNDLLRTFRDHGHTVCAIAPREKRTGLPTELVEDDGIKVLRVAVGNITKTNLIEKGISTLRVKSDYVNALRKHLPGKKFDLVLFATPPTTVYGLVDAVKRQTGAKSYLLLKDIFPQNSLDLGMLSNTGAKSVLYRYFKSTERRTYQAADWIGCMSEANRVYLLAHEPWLNPEHVEVNPNSIIPRDLTGIDVQTFREKYDLPNDERIYVYGGNLGRPQGIGFLIDVLRLNEQHPEGFFLIVGDGTERALLEAYFAENKPVHAKLLVELPKSEFDTMLCACDAGLILLDKRFTIPNFPSRALSYMQASLPVLCATDDASDMGELAEKHGFGVSCKSDDAAAFLQRCAGLTDQDIKVMGEKAHAYLLENYTAEQSYRTIVEHFND